MWCHYNTVNFLPNPHERYPIYYYSHNNNNNGINIVDDDNDMNMNNMNSNVLAKILLWLDKSV